MKQIYSFSIAEISILLDIPFEIEISKEFSPFAETCQPYDTRVYFHKVSQLDVNLTDRICEIDLFSICHDEKGFYRAYHRPCQYDNIYAIGRFLDAHTEEVLYREQDEILLTTARCCFMHTSFERHMLNCGAMVLHASLIQTELGGLLFTGPSGIGKSTQADLWSKLRKADILNGDRAVLRKIGTKWKAYGSPYAGSSRVFVNRGSKITAIVILQKSEENHIELVNPVMAFQKLYSQMLMNTWDREYVNKIADYIEELIQEVPVYLLACRPDEGAVEILERSLKRSS